jgi:hypothetical protein
LWNTKKSAQGHSEQKAWNKRRGMLTYSVVLLHNNAQCMSSYSCLHSSTARAFQLGVVWPHSLQLWSHSELLPPVHLPEEPVGITALQQ